MESILEKVSRIERLLESKEVIRQVSTPSTSGGASFYMEKSPPMKKVIYININYLPNLNSPIGPGSLHVACFMLRSQISLDIDILIPVQNVLNFQADFRRLIYLFNCLYK